MSSINHTNHKAFHKKKKKKDWTTKCVVPGGLEACTGNPQSHLQ